MAQPAMYTRGSTSAGNALIYEKRTITQVRKTIRDTGEWRGFVVPNKVNPHHFFDGWCLAVDRIFRSQSDLDDLVDMMMYYMDHALGDRVAFYEEVKGREDGNDG